MNLWKLLSEVCLPLLFDDISSGCEILYKSASDRLILNHYTVKRNGCFKWMLMLRNTVHYYTVHNVADYFSLLEVVSFCSLTLSLCICLTHTGMRCSLVMTQHQVQFGVQCLTQGHFDKDFGRFRLWTEQPSLLSEPQLPWIFTVCSFEDQTLRKQFGQAGNMNAHELEVFSVDSHHQSQDGPLSPLF